jgi:thiamine biosynthesis lipoprotein
MGVQARILLYAPDSSTAESAARAAFDRIAELDAIMSDYRQDSELMRLCRRAGEGPVRVSDDLFSVLEIAQRLSAQSNGAFDVTVGPYVRLWRQARREQKLPSPEDLLEASRAVGWEKMTLDQNGKTVHLEVEGMQLDLGGIAKGYAADAAIATLSSHGIERTMIEFGGDIVVGDAPPELRGWTIKPALADTQMTVVNSAISTSGDTEQFVEIEGKRYSHVIDPRTGLGLTDRIAATVLAPCGVLSDALSTALSVMGEEAGLKMLAREYSRATAMIRRAN